jgi:asparagine synthase (glutamine-hydrolysing)
MCGITGFFLRNSYSSSQEIHKVILSMTGSLSRRGPDNQGTWINNKNNIALGHRRLSILDLSNKGNQPMHSFSGRYVISFNGEIYNHLEIRKKIQESLLKFSWNSFSDTETLLAGFEIWGIDKTLKECIGMFSIALWDNQEHSLILARDRMGEKPLYYGWINRDFVFGSELKALRLYPKFNNLICKEALKDYLSYNYIPAPRSIYKNIYKLEPSSYIKISNKNYEKSNIVFKKYWSIEDTIDFGQKNQLVDDNRAISELETCIKESVSLQMLSDVPIGVFLSGGIDSSIIATFMQQKSSTPIKTFTVGFEEFGFDESLHANAVAKHLGTDHSRLIVTNKDALSIIPQLSEMYDEPFADSSQIPTHLICKSAKEKVTVVLTGDGADEIFGGYNSYNLLPKIWNNISWMPFPFRKFLGNTISLLSIENWNKLGNFIYIFTNKNYRQNHIGRKMYSLKKILKNISSFDQFALRLKTVWENPELLIKAESKYLGDDFLNNNKSVKSTKFSDIVSPLMYKDSISYLPDDILVKVDRAAMFTGLETRVPFLDHRVVSFSWKLPLKMKIRGNQSKWILRQILYKYVPQEILDRPKSGFEIPIDDWLRGPLRDWAENLLDRSRIENDNIFFADPIRKAWEEHLSKKYNYGAKLWSILMFQSWLETQNKKIYF